MKTRSLLVGYCAFALSITLLGSPSALAQRGFGVNAAGDLFHFQVPTPGNPVVTVGNLGFVPEGIDFRPGTSSLYAIDIGPNTSQLYTVNKQTGAATPVGAGFTSAGVVNGVPYDLTRGTTFGFDFNPTTLQGDGSIRIRLVSNNGQNLRLNSDTGLIAAVDGGLMYAAADPTNPGAASGVDAVAYINTNAATAGGTTALYDMDPSTDDLSIQSPPNAGTLNTVGPFGVTVDAVAGIGFDIFTDPASNDPTIGGDFGYAVLRRPIIGGPLGDYLFYDVNLATGQITNGALVGVSGGGLPADFTGGLAITVPEPSTLALGFLAGLAGLAGLRRRRR